MPKSPLRLYWWSPRHSFRTFRSEARHNLIGWASLGGGRRAMTNYGDELSPRILEAVTGRAVRWARLGQEDVVAIGSVLANYLSVGGRGLVWGSGLNRPLKDLGLRAPDDQSRFLVVRGPMSRVEFALPEEIPVGDPGLLSQLLLTRSNEPKKGAVIVPHFTVFNSRSGRARVSSLRRAGYRIVEPTSHPADMIRQIGSADHVFSSGLHGIIVAHSLDRPARLISFADSAPPVSYKYRDYFASIGQLKPQISPFADLLNLRALAAVDEPMQVELERARPLISRMQQDLVAAAKVLG